MGKTSSMVRIQHTVSDNVQTGRASVTCIHSFIAHWFHMPQTYSLSNDSNKTCFHKVLLRVSAF